MGLDHCLNILTKDTLLSLFVLYMFRLFSIATQKGTFPQLPRLKNVSVSLLAPHPAVGYSILKIPVIKTNTLTVKSVNSKKNKN